MAEGVRIRFRDDSGLPLNCAAMLVLRDHDRPIPNWSEQTQAECRVCKATGNPPKHAVKTYHIQLGGDGTTVVSTGVWEGVQRCASQPFEAVNPVPQPPTQSLLLAPPALARS